jgi:hypothetical protein
VKGLSPERAAYYRAAGLTEAEAGALDLCHDLSAALRGVFLHPEDRWNEVLLTRVEDVAVRLMSMPTLRALKNYVSDLSSRP